MNPWNLLKNYFSKRHRAISIYRAAMQDAHSDRHEEALDKYSSVIDMNETPADVRAMALFNRALLYSASHEYKKVSDDLAAAIGIVECPDNVKVAARQKIARMNHQSQK
jgi:hypothetical protein